MACQTSRAVLCGSMRTRLAPGTPLRAISTSSPASTRASNFESSVLACPTFTRTGRWYVLGQAWPSTYVGRRRAHCSMPLRAGRTPTLIRLVPIYEYKCDKGHVFEVMQRMTDDPVKKCPECG